MKFSLSRQNAVEIKGGGFHLEMPLADHGGMVSRFLHFLGKVLALCLDTSTKVVRVASMGVLTRDYSGPTGSTDGIRTKGILELHALLGEAIDGGRGIQLGQATAVGTDGLRGMVIRHDEQDIGLLRHEVQSIQHVQGKRKKEMHWINCLGVD